MSCASCSAVTDIDDLSAPYIVRTCADCGRSINLRPPGKHGIGIQIQKNDKFVFPAGFLKLSANPLVATGQLTRAGLELFAKHVFIERTARGVDVLAEIAARKDELQAQALASPLLEGVDKSDGDAVWAAIEPHSSDPAYWAILSGAALELVEEEIAAGNAAAAALAMTQAERLRALTIFKEHFESVVWMGQAAGSIIRLLRLWDAHRENADEGFWQATIEANAFALSQLFSIPITLIQGNAYVGGMRLDRGGAKFADFLMAGGSADDAVIVEIKTPKTALVGTKYRGLYKPSAEITGAIVQLAQYRSELTREIMSKSDASQTFSETSPRAILIAGTYAALSTNNQQRSFDLFRRSLSRDLEIITFDEFFLKIEHLAKIFALTKKTDT